MASPTPPSSPLPAGDDRPIVVVDAPVVVPFDEKLRRFWARYQKAIMAFCVLVLVAIVGKGGWEAYQAHRENGIAADYAKATTSEQLKAFASSHEGDVLAGVAHLRLADEAYAAGKYAEAVPHYTKAVETMKSNPLAPRARVGSAMAKLLSGDRAGGEAGLKAIGSDLSEPTAIRAEATYHLASLASEKGDDAAVQTLVAQLNTISPQSFWAQRAGILRLRPSTGVATPESTAPAAAAPADAPAPSVTFPSSKK